MPETENELSDTQLRVAFDGDAVLFSDESEIIVKQHGLDTFFEHEKEFENKPLAQVTDGCFHCSHLASAFTILNDWCFFVISTLNVQH